MNMRITTTYAEQKHADLAEPILEEAYPGAVFVRNDNKISALSLVTEFQDEVLTLAQDTLALSSEDLEHSGIIRVEIIVEPDSPAAPPCEYPVYDSRRYHTWPHMGPCGATETHSHE